jgi:hypothetical protein
MASHYSDSTSNSHWRGGRKIFPPVTEASQLHSPSSGSPASTPGLSWTRSVLDSGSAPGACVCTLCLGAQRQTCLFGRFFRSPRLNLACNSGRSCSRTRKTSGVLQPRSDPDAAVRILNAVCFDAGREPAAWICPGLRFAAGTEQPHIDGLLGAAPAQKDRSPPFRGSHCQ